MDLKQIQGEIQELLYQFRPTEVKKIEIHLSKQAMEDLFVEFIKQTTSEGVEMNNVPSFLDDLEWELPTTTILFTLADGE